MRVKLGIIIVICCICAAHDLAAMPPDKSPHEAEASTTGVIVGTLLDADNRPLGGHKVVLEIFHEQNPVLAIPKNTTAKGGYRFKNIFQRSDFFYVISTNYKGAAYRTSDVSLKTGEQERKLDLIIASASRAAPSTAVQPGHSPHEMVEKKGWPFDLYQTVAILLSLAAIGYVIFVLRRKPRDRG